MTTPYTKKVKLLGASEFLAKPVLEKLPEIEYVEIVAYKERLLWDREGMWVTTDDGESPWIEEQINNSPILAKGAIVIQFCVETGGYIEFTVELTDTGYRIEKVSNPNIVHANYRALTKKVWKFVREWAAKEL